MKKTIIAAILMAALILAGCSGGKLTMESNDQTRGVDVRSEHFSEGSVRGNVTVEEGECLIVSPMLDQGYFIIRLTPEGSDEPAIPAMEIRGKAMSAYHVSPGSYDLEVRVVERTDGALSVMPYDEKAYAAENDALAQALSGLGLPEELLPEGTLPENYLSGIELPDMTGLVAADRYEVATSVSGPLVEIIAFNVRAASLSGDWESFSKLILYPIDVNGKTLHNEEEFLSYTAGRSFTAEFIDSMTAETCHDMFANSGGISMADGYVWLGESADSGIKTVKIISLSGIEN